MRNLTDVVVVGGGVIGLMSAIELARNNCRVTIIDAGRAGAASPAAGGILLPLYPWEYGTAVNALSRLSLSLYPEWIEQLEPTGIDSGYRVCGLIALVPASEELNRWSEQSGQPVQRLEPARVRELEPAIESSIPALRLPDVATVDNPRLLDALHAFARRVGVTVVAGTAVESLVCRGGRVHGVRAADATWRAGQVVIAAGAWSTELLRPLGLSEQVFPVRGEIQQYRVAPGRLGHIVRTDAEYLVPRADGRILVGSTAERAGYNPVITRNGQRRLRDAATRLMPELSTREPEAAWAGLRPGSQRPAPLIGPVAGVRGLYVNTGHFRNGFTLAPGSAKLLTDQMLERDSSLPLAPYRVGSNTGAGVYS